MPAPPTTPRVLGALPLLAMIALGAWGFQWEVAWNYQPPERLREKAAAVAVRAAEGKHDLAIVGTCMSEQQIHAEIVSATLGEPWRIHNLGGRASGPVDWYLMVKNKLPEDSVEGLVVAWIRGDLTMNPSIWEGQTMDLAAWDDLPSLARWSCSDAGCGIEMALRKGSFAYRYRGFLANMFWQSVGAKVTPKSATLRPEEGTPAEAPDPLQGVQPSPEAAAAGPSAGAPGRGDARQSQLALAYLAALLDLAYDRGIPVWFARMPERSDAPDAGPHPSQAAQQAVIDQLIADHHAKTIEMPLLPMGAFLDDRHVNGYGVKVISTALGEGLKADLPEVPVEVPPATEAPVLEGLEVAPLMSDPGTDLATDLGEGNALVELETDDGAPDELVGPVTSEPGESVAPSVAVLPPAPVGAVGAAGAAGAAAPVGPPSPAGPLNPAPAPPFVPGAAPAPGSPVGPAVPPPPVPRGYVAPPPPPTGGPVGPPLRPTESPASGGH